MRPYANFALLNGLEQRVFIFHMSAAAAAAAPPAQEEKCADCGDTAELYTDVGPENPDLYARRESMYLREGQEKTHHNHRHHKVKEYPKCATCAFVGEDEISDLTDNERLFLSGVLAQEPLRPDGLDLTRQLLKRKLFEAGGADLVARYDIFARMLTNDANRIRGSGPRVTVQMHSYTLDMHKVTDAVFALAAEEGFDLTEGARHFVYATIMIMTRAFEKKAATSKRLAAYQARALFKAIVCPFTVKSVPGTMTFVGSKLQLTEYPPDEYDNDDDSAQDASSYYQPRPFKQGEQQIGIKFGSISFGKDRYDPSAVSKAVLSYVSADMLHFRQDNADREESGDAAQTYTLPETAGFKQFVYGELRKFWKDTVRNIAPGFVEFIRVVRNEVLRPAKAGRALRRSLSASPKSTKEIETFLNNKRYSGAVDYKALVETLLAMYVKWQNDLKLKARGAGFTAAQKKVINDLQKAYAVVVTQLSKVLPTPALIADAMFNALFDGCEQIMQTQQ